MLFICNRLNSWWDLMSYINFIFKSRLLFAFLFVSMVVGFFGTESVNAQVKFEDKTASTNGFHTGESWGAAWGDFNNDYFPDLFVSNHAMTSSIYRNNADGTFTDVTLQADLDQRLVKPGNININLADRHAGTWADFDNDGDQDLFIAGSYRNEVLLLQNNGSGQFRERSIAYGLNPTAFQSGRMPMLADYSGDGLLDLFYAHNGLPTVVFKQQGGRFVNVTNQVGMAGQCPKNRLGFASRLFRNGNLVYVCMEGSQIVQKAFDTSTIPFKDVTSAFDYTGLWSDAVLADIDNNGFLDMIVTTGKTRPNGVQKISPTRIEGWLSVAKNQEKKVTFKANGKITVKLYSRKIATRNKSNGNQYDKIFIGKNGSYPTKLPVNLYPGLVVHHGVVEDRGPLGFYMGFDRASQRWTLYLSAKNSSDLVYFTVDTPEYLSKPIVTGLTGSDGLRKPKIFLNNGARMVDMPGYNGLSKVHCGAIAAADFDNDMDIDLYMVCRNSIENLENRFYWNKGDGTFRLGSAHGAEGVVGKGIYGRKGTGEMAVTADYDGDGFMDLFVTNGNRLFPHFRKDKFTSGGPDQLFRNKGGNNNHWLQIDLRGTTSNRDGMGTRVVVRANKKNQVREQNGQYHRWSQDHKRLHFGLGSNDRAFVSIHWPDGTKDQYKNVKADRLYTAVQGGGLVNKTLHSVSIEGSTVREGKNAILKISLSKPASRSVSVDYYTSKATAINSSDYTSRSGTVVFKPGEQVKIRTLKIVEDSRAEGTESFIVALRNPEYAFISNRTAKVTIVDDD